MSKEDLHGSAPDRSPVVLLLIDLINDLEWPGADDILADALRMAERIAALKNRATSARVSTIYVNDNFGRWKSDFRAQIEHCLNDGTRGRPIVELLRPRADDYFVLKPLHSGFFGTSLELLLRHLDAQTLILTGIAGNNCVLFTANDAYMRGYHLVVPPDGILSNSPEENRSAVLQMRSVLKAETIPCEAIDFARLQNRAGR